MRGLLVVGDPLRVPSGQASTGSGRTDAGSGVGGAPRLAPLDSWEMTRVEGPLRCPQDLRQAQGERILEARVRWGVGDAMADGDAPRGAPALDSRVRGNDARGGGPLRDAGAVRTGFDRLRANGFGRRACGGEWGCDGDGDAPRLAPLDSCLRRNDARGGARDPSKDDGGRRYDGGRRRPHTRPLPWIPAFAGMTRVGERGNDGGGVRPGEGWWWWVGGPRCCGSALRGASGRTGARSVVAGGVWGASSLRSPGRTGRHATRPRHGPRRPGRWGDGRVPPFAAGPPWRPP